MSKVRRDKKQKGNPKPITITEAERERRREMSADAYIEIADLVLLEILILLDQAFIYVNDNKLRLRLYLKYLEWDREMMRTLLIGKYIEFYKKWMLVEGFQPVKRAYNEEPELRDLIQADLNRLRKILKEKQLILEKVVAIAKRDNERRFAKPSPKEQETKKTIEELLIVRPPESRKVFAYINRNYNQPIHPRSTKTGSAWDILCAIADKKERMSISAKGNKKIIDYFNTNRACPLYSKTGYRPSRILRMDGGEIVPAIKIKIQGRQPIKPQED